MKDFIRGLKSGIPIGLGYLSVSFSFGILAVSLGFEWWQAVIISMTTLTSAGQLAAVNIMAASGGYVAMLVSQLTVNVRYSFMSVSLSQKVTPEFKGIKRWLFGFFITDEIFAVASAQNSVNTRFFGGLSVMPYIGWALGTLSGSLLGNILPESVMNALCIAIYGMFIAIIAPVAKASKPLLLSVAISAALSCAFYYIPLLSGISSGIAISVCAIAAAVVCALFFPVKEEEGGNE
ncbi:MAG: AzlC family ABC transporter permease [Clostridia bacterium]|nr:AzlC family ABC transporter permease [Clostridia bacterium]MBQ9848733.1 AzlC family ABC transporter permease [Clostridia bacterium]